VAVELDRQRQQQQLSELTDEQALACLRTLHLSNPGSAPSRLLQSFAQGSSAPTGLLSYSSIIANFINTHSASVAVDEAYAAPLVALFAFFVCLFVSPFCFWREEKTFFASV